MVNENRGMDTLIDKMKTVRAIAERLENQIDAAEPDALGAIRTAYTAHLAPEWSALSTTYQRPNTWDTLQQRTEELARFVHKFADVVQQPRRSGIAQDLNAWLQDWVRSSVEWQEYLRYATDEQLEEIETQLSKLEQPGLGDEEIEGLTRRWLNYQVKRLNATEKHASHVIDWLDLVNQNLVDGRQLVGELLSPILEVIPEEGEHPVVTQIRRKWGEQLRDQIVKGPVKVETLALDECLTENENNWQTIRNSLTNLSAALATCSETEITGIQKQIDSWQSIDYEQIDELLKAIAEIRSFEEWCEEHSSFLDVDLTDESVATQEIQELINSRPIMPAPDNYSSLNDFQDAMANYKGEAEAWLEQCREVYRHIQEQIETWENSLLPEDIRQQFIQIGEDLHGLTSLDQLAQMSWKLQDTVERARAFAEESLAPDERAIWQRLQQLKRDGKQAVNLIELDANEPMEQVTNVIIKLAKQGLITVRVEL